MEFRQLLVLERAIAERNLNPVWCIIPIAGCSTPQQKYVRVLLQHQMIPSMGRPANPYDNASSESFIKTLKREEI